MNTLKSFENLEKLIEYCRGLNLPFDIDKRISPFTTGPNRLQIIRASVVHGIERTGPQSGQSQAQGSLTRNIEIQPTAMYDETDMDIGESLKQKQSQKYFFTSVKSVSIKRPRHVSILPLVVNRGASSRWLLPLCCPMREPYDHPENAPHFTFLEHT